MKAYYRPIVEHDPTRPAGAFPLAGGRFWFDRVAIHRRDHAPELVTAADVPAETLARLTEARANIAGMDMGRANLMGILNVTPDSFSDGGLFHGAEAAVEQALRMAAEGADIVDIGGESTRPGAQVVPLETEIARVQPVIAALRAGGFDAPISVDTRKAPVARAALDVGADLINDVAAFTFDPDLTMLAAETGAPVCLMHAQGTPVAMQDNPTYDDVLLDVYDYLEDRLDAVVAAGVARDRVVVDPGIGFGKTLDHNLNLLRGLSLFHALGCPILLGASRKRFIGTLGNEPEAARRAPGSVAVAQAGAAQGVQILRVHDIRETRQALNLAEAIWNGS